MSTIRNYKSWATARLDESGLTVELHGSAEYTDDGRSVTAAITPAAAEQLAATHLALKVLLENQAAALERATTLAAAEALGVAARMGELK